jgi:hypothetical protein
MAARALGVDQVPVEYQDYESEAAEYNDLIADNRIAELAERDMSIIKDLLEELDTGANDMDLTGYTEAEIERLMTQYHVEGENDPNAEWEGMPEFDNPPKGFSQCVVHFKGPDQMAAFGELIGQTITEKTRSIWYPQSQNTPST